MYLVRIVLEGILCAMGLFLMWRVLFARRWPARPDGPAAPPRISVIIPARDEEGRIGRLLRSLAGQTVPPCEIIVVDDGSSDNTRGVALAHGASVLTGEPPEEGWNGKAWACWQGARASTGDLLLFLDADTWLEPQGIERLLLLYPGDGLLTVQPYHVTEKAYEGLSAFFNIVVVAALDAFTPLGERITPGGGFGPCTLCGRATYLAIGGHWAVRQAVLEDIPLARLFRQNGLPVRCHVGRDVISFRMYGGGPRELVRGWTKGMAYGALAVTPVFSILMAAWITGCFGALFALLRAVRSLPEPSLAWAGFLIYPAYALAIRQMLRGIGRFPPWAWALFPIPLGFFGAITARSLLHTYLFRRVMWKGRAVRVGRPER